MQFLILSLLEQELITWPFLWIHPVFLFILLYAFATKEIGVGAKSVDLQVHSISNVCPKQHFGSEKVNMFLYVFAGKRRLEQFKVL